MSATTAAACPHGYPSPASCIDCMDDGPVGPPLPASEQLLVAETWSYARHESPCARRRRLHTIGEGDPIGLVEGVGWCCAECVR